MARSPSTATAIPITSGANQPTPIPTPPGGIYPISVPTTLTVSCTNCGNIGAAATPAASTTIGQSSGIMGVTATGTAPPGTNVLASVGLNGAGNGITVSLQGTPAPQTNVAGVNYSATQTPAPDASPHFAQSDVNNNQFANINPPTNPAPFVTVLGPTTTGTMTSTSTFVSLPISGYSGVSVFIGSGTYAGTLAFRVSADPTCSATTQGTLSTILSAPNLGTPAGNATANVNNATYVFNAAPFRCFEIIATAFTSGSVNVTISASVTPPSPTLGTSAGGIPAVGIQSASGVSPNIVNSSSISRSVSATQTSMAVVSQTMGHGSGTVLPDANGLRYDGPDWKHGR